MAKDPRKRTRRHEGVVHRVVRCVEKNHMRRTTSSAAVAVDSAAIAFSSLLLTSHNVVVLVFSWPKELHCSFEI